MAGDRANMRDWILSAADGEPVEAVVIGVDEYYDKPDAEPYQLRRLDLPSAARDYKNWNRVWNWQQAEALLDYDFDPSFGHYTGHFICAWTPSKVIFISEYDGSQQVCTVPRHPTAHRPYAPGG